MSSALRTFQRQLDVTGHNIANVETPGYSRQAVDLTANDPSYLQQGRLLSIGNGVSIASVNRIRDMFLEGRRTAATSDLGKTNAQTSGMGKVESIVLEPGDSGVSDALDKFWNSWSGLSSSPGSAGQKAAVQQAGQTLADRVRASYNQLKTVKDQTGTQIDQLVKDIQSDVDRIGQLNLEIRQKSAMGSEPNDLLDMRDTAVRSLADKVDINVNKFGDGSYVISMNGLSLVDQQGSHTVPTTWDAATGTLSDSSGTFPVRSGQLSGLFDTVNKISSYQANLDSLANNLRTTVNGLVSSGINGAGATGLKFFNDVPVTSPATPQSGAIDFNLDTTGVVGPPASAGIGTDPNAIPSGTSGAASDGSLALALSRVRDTKIAALGNRTFSNFYSDYVGMVGRDSATATSRQTTQMAVVEQIDNQIQSVSGVSLDDEMATMLRVQRSFQAAAKALSTMDEVTQTLIDMLKR